VTDLGDVTVLRGLADLGDADSLGGPAGLFVIGWAGR